MGVRKGVSVIEIDRAATQEFAIRSVFLAHYGTRLAGNDLERMVAVVVEEMTCGRCAWAFNAAGYVRPPFTDAEAKALEARGEVPYTIGIAK